MTLYRKTYRAETTRRTGHNYAYGTYFVTICRRKKMQWFGEICEGKIKLNDVGKIVASLWQKIPTHFPGTQLGSFVIMPNHLHGIIQPNIVETRESRVSTVKHTLGMIVNQFKGIASKNIRAAGHEEFHWQPRFHDRIVRSAKELLFLESYIANNTKSWDKETIPWHADATSWSP